MGLRRNGASLIKTHGHETKLSFCHDKETLLKHKKFFFKFSIFSFGVGYVVCSAFAGYSICLYLPILKNFLYSLAGYQYLSYTREGHASLLGMANRMAPIDLMFISSSFDRSPLNLLCVVWQAISMFTRVSFLLVSLLHFGIL